MPIMRWVLPRPEPPYTNSGFMFRVELGLPWLSTTALAAAKASWLLGPTTNRSRV